MFYYIFYCSDMEFYHYSDFVNYVKYKKDIEECNYIKILPYVEYNIKKEDKSIFLRCYTEKELSETAINLIWGYIKFMYYIWTIKKKPIADKWIKIKQAILDIILYD